MNLLDLCSGSGGFHLAAEMAGMVFDQCFYSDINEYANKIYQSRFPSAVALGDLRNIRGNDLPRGRYVVCAGFPCQPFSVAGAGLGIGDERYLWHEILRIVTELAESGSSVDYFIFENVAGLESTAFSARETRVELRRRERHADFDHFEAIYLRQEELQLGKCLDDLEKAGASFQTFDIPALGVNAWHRRRRIWIVGSIADRDDRQRIKPDGQIRAGRDSFDGCVKSVAADHSDLDGQRCVRRSESGSDGQRQIRAGRRNDQSLGKSSIGDRRNNADLAGDRTQESEGQDGQPLESGFGQGGLDGQRTDSDDHDERKFQPKRGVGNKRRRVGNGNSFDSADDSGTGLKKRRQRKFRQLQAQERTRVHDRFEFSDSEYSNSSDAHGERLQGLVVADGRKGAEVRDKSSLRCDRAWSKHWIEVATELCGGNDELSSGLDVARLRADIARLYPAATEKNITSAISRLISQYRKNRIELMGNSIVPAIPKIFFEIIREIENI